MKGINQRRKKLSHFVIYAILTVLAVACLLPFLSMISTSFGIGSDSAADPAGVLEAAAASCGGAAQPASPRITASSAGRTLLRGVRL